MRALPLINMAQEPQTSSRQFESYETGVVGWPALVTGFSLISRRQMMTFMYGRHCSRNSSQCGDSLGEGWRFTLTRTSFFAFFFFLLSMATSCCATKLFCSPFTWRRHNVSRAAEFVKY